MKYYPVWWYEGDSTTQPDTECRAIIRNAAIGFRHASGASCVCLVASRPASTHGQNTPTHILSLHTHTAQHEASSAQITSGIKYHHLPPLPSPSHQLCLIDSRVSQLQRCMADYSLQGGGISRDGLLQSRADVGELKAVVVRGICDELHRVAAVDSVGKKGMHTCDRSHMAREQEASHHSRQGDFVAVNKFK